MLQIKQAATDTQIHMIADLAAVIWQEHFTPIIGTEQVHYMLDKFQSYRAISKAIRTDGYVYYMAYEDTEFCGYCGIHPENDAVFISKVYVEKPYRGKKIARHFIEHVKNEYTDCKKFWLTVNKNNANSIAAYKKMGFEVAREQCTDIGNGFVMDDYVMELNLN